METNAIANTKITRIDHALSTFAEDQLAIEEPLEIQLSFESGTAQGTKTISVTMRTPGNDKELAVGFLFTEGIIKSKTELLDTTGFDPGCNRFRVMLQPGVKPLLQHTERNFYTTSSCGVCGKTSIEAIKTVSAYQPQNLAVKISAGLVYSLPALLRQQQLLFESTGGLHASALFDLDGNFLMLREDVGRHNALDKLIGTAFLNDMLPLSKTILLLSGRASFELVQKAIMAGINIIAAIGAPSSLAVSLAAEYNLTLIGFLRNQQFNIYSGEQRIKSYE